MVKRYWLGVFDRKILRDWTFWFGLVWAVGMGVATAIDPLPDSTVPVAVDAIGVAAVAFFVFGWCVAGVRRLIRIYLARRGSATTQPAATTQPLTVDDNPATAPSSTTSAPRPVSAPPIPLASYDGGELRNQEILAAARHQLPYPVARACRALQGTQDPLEQYQYILDLGEHLTVTIGMLSASWLRAHAPDAQSLRTLRDAYKLRGVSQGHWHDVMNEAKDSMAHSDQALPGFFENVRPKKGGAGLLGDLRTILQERNLASHGARPHNRAEAAVRIDTLGPVIVRAVEQASFLGHGVWCLVEGVALRRHDQRWNVRIRRAMGDHPEFDASTEVLDRPLINETFYVLTESTPLDLSPMLVMRYCPQCRQPEVCHADRVDEGAGVSLKSFARGHQVFDPDLVPEIDNLVPAGAEDTASG